MFSFCLPLSGGCMAETNGSTNLTYFPLFLVGIYLLAKIMPSGKKHKICGFLIEFHTF